ncbi:hypothetical protein HNQ91_003100 [Filimonas zeae]|nr:hypothetical protein [Filimonas zeae]
MKYLLLSVVFLLVSCDGFTDRELKLDGNYVRYKNIRNF